MFDKKEYMKNYTKSPQCKKNTNVNAWKFKGLIESEEFIDQIYEEYLNSEECELCGEPYLNGNFKSMDHCHLTGKFRNIVCNRCNQWRIDRAGKNITKCKNRNLYRVQIQRNYKCVLNKFYKTEEECREVLNQFIIDNPHYFT